MDRQAECRLRLLLLNRVMPRQKFLNSALPVAIDDGGKRDCQIGQRIDVRASIIAKAKQSRTLRRRPVMSSSFRRGCWIRLPVRAWRLASPVLHLKRSLNSPVY